MFILLIIIFLFLEVFLTEADLGTAHYCEMMLRTHGVTDSRL